MRPVIPLKLSKCHRIEMAHPRTLSALASHGADGLQVTLAQAALLPIHCQQRHLGSLDGRKEGRFIQPWQPARLIGWNQPRWPPAMEKGFVKHPGPSILLLNMLLLKLAMLSLGPSENSDPDNVHVAE